MANANRGMLFNVKGRLDKLETTLSNNKYKQ